MGALSAFGPNPKESERVRTSPKSAKRRGSGHTFTFQTDSEGVRNSEMAWEGLRFFVLARITSCKVFARGCIFVVRIVSEGVRKSPASAKAVRGVALPYFGPSPKESERVRTSPKSAKRRGSGHTFTFRTDSEGARKSEMAWEGLHFHILARIAPCKGSHFHCSDAADTYYTV